MRVLILANNDVGLYKFRKEILQELIKSGHEVHLALPNGEYIEKLVDLGCRFIDTPLSRRGMNPVVDFKLLLKYVKLIKRIKPSVVFTYTIKPNIYGGIACRLTRCNYLANITGLGTSIENPGLLQKIVLFLYRLGINGSECTFFQNKTNMDFMLERKIRGKEVCLLPGSGIDINIHQYHEYPEEAEVIRFLSVMRIMKDKGISELLECAEKIHGETPNVEFTLVGDYDDDTYRELVEKAHQNGIVKYLGFRRDIDELMAEHHCIINPSYHEGMSNVLLEAAACGRPVIASNIPGCKETFEEGVSGFGFEVKNSESLISVVNKFMSMPHCQKIAMGRAGRNKAETEFDRNKVVSEYMARIQYIKQKNGDTRNESMS